LEGFPFREAAGGEVSLTFRWLGVAGVELNANGQLLAIDPFFTRPSLLGLIKPVVPDSSLVAEKLPNCNAVLVTHSHWDHLMDVPHILGQTGATAFGSANTCCLLKLLGVPVAQVNEVRVGDKLSLGAFEVKVVAGQHSSIPFDFNFNGALAPGLMPPLRLQDYRMDLCLGYSIQVGELRVLICAAQPHPADVLFTVAQESKKYYLRLLQGTQPHTFVPIHWDNFLRTLRKPLQKFTRPGRIPLRQLARLAQSTIQGINVIIPEIFREYTVGG
jgi:hypothetical protein